MERRTFIKSATALSAFSLTMPSIWATETPTMSKRGGFHPSPANGWRIIELVSTLKLNITENTAQAWLPLPSHYDAEWAKPMGNIWEGNASSMQIKTDPVYQADMLHAQWDGKHIGAPTLKVVSRIALRDRSTDFDKPQPVPGLSSDDRQLFTKATKLIPVDGIVLKTANKIVDGKQTDLEKAQAIYDWVVENTMRDPKVKACGLGNIKWMLETGNLKGKCADLNALYVGLARSVGLPARDLYGIRVADSRFGYNSLGKSGLVSKAQHCRAEVFLSGFGWIAVDPADVRKVMLEENKQQLALEHPKVQAVRNKLFGGWESNWLPYNIAHDLSLPGSKGAPIPFLMYPHGETVAGKRLNSINPNSFKYELISRELSS